MSRIAAAALMLGVTIALMVTSACDTDGTVLEGYECADDAECVKGCYCWNDICVKEGALEFSLVWTDETDLDLYVETPTGETLGWSGELNAAGGTYSVYDCWEQDCIIEDGNHVEHVFFADSPDDGTYDVFVHNFSGLDAADFTIEVLEYGDTVTSFTGSLPDEQVSSEHYTYDYN